jgi:hypothetical protein
MNLLSALLTGASQSALMVEDVFSAYTYTGNGGTQTIVNGIDLAGHGGMVWQKDRTVANRHMLSDTVQGPGKFMFSNQTDATNSWGTSGYSFNSNGFSVGYPTYINASGSSIASWTFRRAAKFFDVVQYTGNGTTVSVAPPPPSVHSTRM